MRMYTKTGRSIWPGVCGVLALVVVVLLVVVATRGGDERAAPAPPLVPVPGPGETSSSAAPVLSDRPTGCLGGPGVDAGMLLATQARAPHTTAGAAEVAASYTRWVDRYPFPDAAQIKTVEDNVLSTSMADRDFAAAFALVERTPALQQNKPPGAPFRTPYTTSTRPGKYLVDSTSTTDRVELALSTAAVVGGVVSTETYTSGSVAMVWERGAWRIVGRGHAVAAAQLRDDGTLFTGGC